MRLQISNLDELQNIIVPFFNKHLLVGKKDKDFKLWAKAVQILFKHKVARGEVNPVQGIRGFQKVEWSNGDLVRLKQIQELCATYKSKGSKLWSSAELGSE